MKLRVIEGERFSCGSCTNCCRDWHVELTEREIATLPNLVWPAGDELAGKDVLYRHAGRVFLAHRRDASCVYLNPLNGLCRVHEVFGESVKPFGCRLYPFVLNPTFPGDTRVGARFDCPNVRDNAGLPHADHLPELRRLERELAPPETTGDRAFSGLAFDQAQAVVEFLSTFLAAFPTDEGKALFLYKMSSALASVAPSEISREGLAAVFGPLKSKVETAVAFDIGPASALARAAFRALLAQYLRRDEDILNGFASRGGRLLAMSRVVLGGGTLRGLGRHHPTIGIGRPRGLTTRFPPTRERSTSAGGSCGRSWSHSSSWGPRRGGTGLWRACGRLR